MGNSTRRSAWLGALLLAAASAPSAAETLEPPLRGRTISEVLRGLEDAQLRFLYSSELLPDDRRVRDEPAARGSVGIATEILAPYGLTLRHLGGPVYAVVRRADALPGVATAAAGSAARDLEEIVVTAGHYSLLPTSSTPVQQIDGAALERQPGAAQDTLRALQHLPGFASDGISAAANVRGSAAADTLILFDGFPLRRSLHFSSYQGPFSILDETLLQRVDVYTGGFAARYGNRSGAVIDARTIDARDEPRHSLGFDVFNAYARAAGVSAGGKVDWLIGTREGLLGTLLPSDASNLGRPDYADAYLRASYRPTDTLELTGNVLWAGDRYVLREDDEAARLVADTRYFWLRARAMLGEERSASLWLGHTGLILKRSGYVDKPGVIAGTLFEERSANATDARGLIDWRWNDSASSQAGFEWSHTRGRLDYEAGVELAPATAELFGRPASYADVVDALATTNRTALFADYRWHPPARLAADVGLRLEMRPGTGKLLATEWRTGVRWTAGPRSRVQLRWDRIHESEDVFDWPAAIRDRPFRGVSVMDIAIAALDQTITQSVTLRLEAYRKHITGPAPRLETQLHSINPLPELAPDFLIVAAPVAVVQGVELVFNLDRQRWRLWSALSLANAADRIAGRSVLRSWDEHHAWNTRLDYRRGRWTLTTGLNWHDGWPTTPLIAGANGELRLGSRNGARLPDFATLNLRIEYRRPLSLGTLTAILDVHNLANRANVYGSEVDTPSEAGGSALLGRKVLNALPRIPSAGLRWEF
jgi:hypothetical protein